jgi:hypothetical protein
LSPYNLNQTKLFSFQLSKKQGMDGALIHCNRGHNYFSFRELALGDNYAGITPGSSLRSIAPINFFIASHSKNIRNF